MDEKKYSPTLKKALGLVFFSVLLLSLVNWYIARSAVRGVDFTLNHRGQTWRFINHAKKINLIYFGYTSCPDVCPLALSITATAFNKLSSEALAQIQFVFISVDYQHDSPEKAAQYAFHFHPHFIGLTGSEKELRQTAKLIGASFILQDKPDSYLGYSLAHTDKVFFLNEEGTVLSIISNPRSADEILSKLKEYL